MDIGRFITILKENLLKVLNDELISVAIFGSLARGTAKFPESDIDLLIVTDKPIRGFKRKVR